MSYQVIALRWRPQTFAHMMGQNHVSQTLLNALKNQCLPQALLFTGLRGTGKTSAARILAKSMRCTNLKNHIPCGQCKECEDISLSRNLDVIEIDGASHNGVDSIRDLRNSVSFRPTTGHKKIYIIDEVHMLSSNAFNALLKTLEEPPEHVTFILATTEIHKIPKTILSRCHRFDFRKVPIREITNYLEHICKEENIKYEMQALWAISRQGEGSVRDALSFLDQVMVYSHCNITYLSVIESLGLTDRRLLMQILSNIVSQEVQGLIQNLDSIFSSGTDVGIFAEDFLEEIKNLLIIKNVGLKSDYLDLPEEEVQVLLEISQKISEAHIHLLFDMMLETTQMILRSQDPRTVLEVGLLKLCLYPQVFDMQKEALKNISSAQRPSAPTLSLQSQKKGQSIQNPVSSESGSSGSGSSGSVSSERGSSESGSSESGSSESGSSESGSSERGSSERGSSESGSSESGSSGKGSSERGFSESVSSGSDSSESVSSESDSSGSDSFERGSSESGFSESVSSGKGSSGSDSSESVSSGSDSSGSGSSGSDSFERGSSESGFSESGSSGNRNKKLLKFSQNNLNSHTSSGSLNDKASKSTSVAVLSLEKIKPESTLEKTHKEENSGHLSSLSDLDESQKIKMWHDFITKVKRKNNKMGSTLQNCLYTISKDQVKLAAPEKLLFIQKDIEQPHFQKALKEYIKNFLGSDYDLIIESKTSYEVKSSFAEEQKTALKEQEDLQIKDYENMVDKISQSHIIKEIKEKFNNAEIISVEEMEGQ